MLVLVYNIIIYIIYIGIGHFKCNTQGIAWVSGVKCSPYSVSKPRCMAGHSLDLNMHPWVREYFGFLFCLHFRSLLATSWSKTSLPIPTKLPPLTIKTVDRTANLSDAFFPSIVICNINQLRKSFIYWLHDNIHQNIRLNDQSPHT